MSSSAVYDLEGYSWDGLLGRLAIQSLLPTTYIESEYSMQPYSIALKIPKTGKYFE